MATTTHPKYQLVESLIQHKLLKVTNQLTGSEYFGQFMSFNEHINLGLILKNVLSLKDGKAYSSCVVGDVEVRNNFNYSTYEHVCSFTDATTITCESFGLLNGQRVSMGKLTIEILAATK